MNATDRTGDAVRRYDHLLQLAGRSRESLRRGLTTQPHTPGSQHITLRTILQYPERFTALLQPVATQRQADVRTLASVLQQNLALQVIGPLTLTLFLDRHTVLPPPDDIWLDTSTPSGQWHYRTDRGERVDEASYVEAMPTRLNDWYRVFRKQLGVSAGAYWSSAALALCAAYTPLYDCAPPQPLCDEATHWLARFDCDAHRFVTWLQVNLGGGPRAIPQRRGCCQKYRLPDGGYCGTCGIYRKDRLKLARQ